MPWRSHCDRIKVRDAAKTLKMHPARGKRHEFIEEHHPALPRWWKPQRLQYGLGQPCLCLRPYGFICTRRVQMFPAEAALRSFLKDHAVGLLVEQVRALQGAGHGKL